MASKLMHLAFPFRFVDRFFNFVSFPFTISLPSCEFRGREKSNSFFCFL